MSNNNSINTTGAPIKIDPDEFSVAEKEAAKAGLNFTLAFRKPFEYNGKQYTELNFEWDNLTGRDALNIESEMARLGKALIAPAFSGEYLIRMAAKACIEKVGSDAFEAMPIIEYNKIRSAARSFLLKSEL